ncbi:probable polyamine transporter At3g13620 [Miscanthus floridulus]|uniref:probable polyamine transporter At3g13620 n=1 Tax=Miscanthus floridulus TaxID=154761 RepID=UPI00345B2B4C
MAAASASAPAPATTHNGQARADRRPRSPRPAAACVGGGAPQWGARSPARGQVGRAARVRAGQRARGAPRGRGRPDRSAAAAEVAGGPYGAEPAVQVGGPLLALIGFFVFPFVWAVPESLVTVELSTAMPGNGRYVVWVDRAFGPFVGFLMGTWKVTTIVTFNIALTLLNYTGLSVVGWTAVALGLAALSPFLLMVGAALLPKVQPRRWGATAGDKDWKLLLNTLFWNLNGCWTV